jgi:hypothetical protein
VSLLLVLWSGAAAGSLHVVSGVDHLAALLPLSVGGRLKAFGIGARWGLGHSGGVLLIGGLAVLLREQIDVEAVGAVGERLVGLMLIALGAFGLRRALRLKVHAHPHQHAGEGHIHLHAHSEPSRPAGRCQGGHDRLPHRHAHAAFAAGTLHGVAGTAHLLGVLPAVVMDETLLAAAYLGSFAVGTVLAMGAFSALVGEGTARFSESAPTVLRGLMYAAGAVTVLVGVAWILIPATGFRLSG